MPVSLLQKKNPASDYKAPPSPGLLSGVGSSRYKAANLQRTCEETDYVDRLAAAAPRAESKAVYALRPGPLSYEPDLHASRRQSKTHATCSEVCAIVVR